jgi:F-type H+-transporting ATPase subunit gamma
MAGGQERILRRRIKSVQATKKITRAMELIAASRIVKAQARVLAAQPYADGITEVVRDLQAAGGGSNSPLLVPRESITRVAQVIIAADRGLCGGYNSVVIRAGEAQARRHKTEGRDAEFVAVGRKTESYFRFRNVPIGASFTGFSDNPTYEDARAIAGAVVPRFESGEIDLVEIVYTRFVSSGRQEVVVRPLLPLDREGFEGGDEKPEGGGADYEYEPSPDVILSTLLPRYAEARIYAALLNAAASEHAARQRAMKAATDTAEDLMLTYTRRMNRARQDSSTTEIMEIVGGAEALSSGESKRTSHEDDYYDKSA